MKFFSSLFCLFFLFTVSLAANNVSYDSRSLIIDGQRKLLISAAIHYPRSVPTMWPGLVQTAKNGGVDVIETYVFWNGHEISPGHYYFGGRYDLVKFVKIVQQAGMYLILRIGPFVAAEWNFGGVPVWLHYVPGTVFRTDNEPFKHYMQKFMAYIVNMMKQEKLFASQGGPIILSQERKALEIDVLEKYNIDNEGIKEDLFKEIKDEHGGAIKSTPTVLGRVENEYGFYEAAYGNAGKSYALWAAEMALSQNIGVPWVMCQQWDTPEPVINTCNSFYCDQFTPSHPNMPKIWTENWPGCITDVDDEEGGRRNQNSKNTTKKDKDKREVLR